MWYICDDDDDGFKLSVFIATNNKCMIMFMIMSMGYIVFASKSIKGRRCRRM